MTISRSNKDAKTVTSPASSAPADETQRRIEAEHLQVTERNPLTPAESAMFEMFEGEGWSHERRRALIAAQFKRPLSPEAAEICHRQARAVAASDPAGNELMRFVADVQDWPES